jgi:predicted TIM-barrel fold metal-dependent hydrolase
MITDEIAVIDTDSHLSELADLWLSRLPTKWADVAPTVKYLPSQGEEYWFIGGHPTHPAWTNSQAKWEIPPPSHPRVLDEVDPSNYDVVARVAALDEFGVASQVLYPNIVAFHLQSILGVGDPGFAIACMSAYNDHVVEFAAAAPDRFVPIMALPFWDLEASLRELERSGALGHKGVVFANRPEVLGAPPIVDSHWDPLWARAQELGLSINFHIGFGAGFGTKSLMDGADAAVGQSPPVSELPPGGLSKQMIDLGDEWVTDYRLDLVRIGNRTLLSNSGALLDLILAGVCERFPQLAFVSVESGFGYFPFVLESADWNWVACGASRSLPNRLLPSEYFRRQCYATFWFESDTVTRMVDLYADNVMFETDFPHTVALMPGAGPNIKSAKDTIEANLASLSPVVLRKILSENARRVYHLD